MKDKNQKTKDHPTLFSLLRLLEIQDNWNIPPEAIKNCKKVIEKITVCPAINPTERESVQIEFGKENSKYLEIEFFTDKAHYLETTRAKYDSCKFEILEGEKMIEEAIEKIEDFVKNA